MTPKIEPKVSDFIDSLQPIAAEISVNAARNLTLHFGGTRLYVPRAWRSEADVNVIGEEDARKLCALFGPERIDIPRMPFTPQALKRLVDALRLDGRSNAEIARELGLSWRTVTRLSTVTPDYSILTKKRGRVSDSRQVDLEEWLTAHQR